MDGIFARLIALIPDLSPWQWLTASGTGIASVFGGFKGAVWLREHLQSQYKIHTIRKTDHKLANEFCLLYYRLIDENHRIDFSQIEMWIDTKGSNDANQEIKVCTYKNIVVGFCQFFYSKNYPYAFVSYLGVDSENPSVTSGVSGLLLKNIRAVLNKRFGNDYVVLFEVESPTEKGLDERERARRIARIRHFTRLGKEKNRQVHQIRLNYVQPETPNESDLSNQHCMQLLVASPRNEFDNNRIHIDSVLDWISFIYYDIYLYSYHSDIELREIYEESLTDLVKEIRKTSTKWISIN